MSVKGKGKAVAWLREHATYEGDDCLVFPFARNPQKGYGLFGYNGDVLYAHQFMCELVNGAPPSDEYQASHSCGNGHEGCVTPRHLSWKTNAGNQLDRTVHGTHHRGGVPRNKLTPEQVAEVRSLKGVETQASLARRFGVKVGCIEYWQRIDRQPVLPGTSKATMDRNAAKLRQHILRVT